MVHRGRRSREARERRKGRHLSRLDQKTGEVINVQPRFVRCDVVPKSFGFLGVKAASRGDGVHVDKDGFMFLYLGEVLIDWRGEGTIQVHPGVFDG